MRERVLQALRWPRGTAPERTARAAHLELARAALDARRALGWRLQRSPARLRIQTIDSLCASLTRQMPVLSRFGAQPESVEDAGALYARSGARDAGLLEEQGTQPRTWRALLAHLDNDVGARRGFAGGHAARARPLAAASDRANERAELEGALARERRDALARRARAAASDGLRAELLARRRTSSATPRRSRPLASRAWRRRMPLGCGSQARRRELLLTKTGDWRKTLTTNDGFPAGDKEQGGARRKQRHAADRAARRAKACATRSPRCAGLPPRATPKRNGRRWARSRACCRARSRSCSSCSPRGQVDFVEVAQRALHALGQRRRADRPGARARLSHPASPGRRIPGHLLQPVRAAGEAHRRLAAGRRAHAVPGRRPDAVDLPLPRGRSRPVPARRAPGHRQR